MKVQVSNSNSKASLTHKDALFSLKATDKRVPTMDQSLNEYGQNLPYNLEAEQSILGSVLIDPGC